MPLEPASPPLSPAASLPFSVYVAPSKYLLLGKPPPRDSSVVYLAAGRLLRTAVLILDPGPACVEEHMQFSHCPLFVLYTLTAQASSEKHCVTFMSCIPVSANETGGKFSFSPSPPSPRCTVLFHIFVFVMKSSQLC